jgi:hypothetical protein
MTAAISFQPSEVWVRIQDNEVEPWYWVSSEGRVATERGHFKELTPFLQSAGYQQIFLRRKNKNVQRGYKRFLLHRLVADHFLAGTGSQVNHINGNKKDNHIENLEFVNNQENIHHAWETGLTTGHIVRLLHIPTNTICEGYPHALRFLGKPTTRSCSTVFRHRVKRGVEPDWIILGKSHQRIGNRNQGENHPTAKFTDEQVAEILALKGSAPIQQVVATFLISKAQVYRIWAGTSRKLQVQK